MLEIILLRIKCNNFLQKYNPNINDKYNTKIMVQKMYYIEIFKFEIIFIFIDLDYRIFMINNQFILNKYVDFVEFNTKINKKSLKISIT